MDEMQDFWPEFDEEKQSTRFYKIGYEANDFLISRDGKVLRDFFGFGFREYDVGHGTYPVCIDRLIVPDGITVIASEAFMQNEDEYDYTLLGEIVLSEGITEIGSRAFSGSGAFAIRLPDSLVALGEGVFEACANLRHLRLPHGISAIPEETFLDCLSLQSVFIPTSVTRIAENAFSGCEELTHILFAGSEQEWERVEGKQAIPTTATLHFEA